jgi:hypothetical protein
MQKIIMELKLLSVAARRADSVPAARGVSDGALRLEIQQLEARLAVRLASHDKILAEKQAAAGQTIEALREQLAGVNSQIAAVLERPVEPALDVDALTRQLTVHINESLEAARQQHTSQLQEAIAAVTQQLSSHVKESNEAAEQQHTARLQEAVADVTRQLTAHAKETVEAADQQHTADVQQAIAAASQQHTAQLQEAIAAATSQLTAHAKETVEATNQQHTAQIQEAIAAASQQHTAQLQEAIAAATSRLTAHAKEAVEAANRQHTAQVEEAIASASQQHAAQVQEAIAAASQKHVEQVNETVAALNQRMGSAEQNMEEIRKHFSTLQSNVAADLHDFEQSLKSQSVAIESARTAMAQTDDLVERVVEALELLQSSVLDQHEAAGVS